MRQGFVKLTPNIGEKSRRLDNKTRIDEGVAEAASSSMISIDGRLQISARTQRTGFSFL